MSHTNDEIPVAPLLATLAIRQHHVDSTAPENVPDRVDDTDRAEAYLSGKAEGLEEAQRTIRDQAGWPVEADSGRN